MIGSIVVMRNQFSSMSSISNGVKVILDAVDSLLRVIMTSWNERREDRSIRPNWNF